MIGTAIVKTHFPEWSYDNETYFLACLLHDIGTADKFLATTKMSFEFKGAIVARDLILSLKGAEDQADSVCDAIIRHQDIFVNGGNITMIGQILQLATILGASTSRHSEEIYTQPHCTDNVGLYGEFSFTFVLHEC